MRFIKNIITSLVLVSFLTINTASEGKTSSSSSSRSSSSRSSSSSSSSRSSSSGWGSSSSKATPSTPSKPSTSWGSGSSSSSSGSTAKPSTSWGNSSSGNSTKPKLSSFAAAQSKEKLLPKEQYVSKFKQENASKYPNKFDKEPTTRPVHIPTTYNNHTVVYNSGMGGYGYVDALGTFILYDALTDMATADYRSYHTYHTTTHSSFAWVYWVCGAILFFILIVALVPKY